jgi:sporulation protein YlmC with PRC-barrel domain
MTAGETDGYQRHRRQSEKEFQVIDADLHDPDLRRRTMITFTRRSCIGSGLGSGAAFVVIGTLLRPTPAMAQAVQLVKVDVAAVSKGFRAKKMLGATVINDKKQEIGKLEDMVIDEKKQIFAVLQVGGFLGLGGHLVALPYDSLEIRDEGKTIELPGASRDALKALAEFHYGT